MSQSNFRYMTSPRVDFIVQLDICTKLIIAELLKRRIEDGMTDRSAYINFFADAAIRHLHLALTFQVHVHPSDLYHR